MNPCCQKLALLHTFNFTAEPPLSIPRLIGLVIHFEHLVLCFHHVVTLLKADDFNTMHIEALALLVIQITCMQKVCISLRGDWTHSLKRIPLWVINTQKVLPTQEISEPKTIGD